MISIERTIKRTIERTLAAVCLVGAALPAVASVVVDATDRGWYSRNVATGTYAHNASNLNYLTGLGFPGGQATITRNFFGFDLSGYAGQTFTSAKLHLYNPSNGFFQFNPGLNSSLTETYELHNVTTSIAALLAGGAGGTGSAMEASFNDLGDGAIFGTAIASLADNGQFIDITLGAAGLSALNAAAGGNFYLGGLVTSIQGSAGSQTIFGFSNDNNLASTQLIFEPATQVPEPAVPALMVAALLAWGAAARKRRG